MANISLIGCGDNNQTKISLTKKLKQYLHISIVVSLAESQCVIGVIAI
jgi:hypothetical protein